MSGLIFRLVAPNSVPTPVAPYYTQFLSDGSRATSSPGSPETISGRWYRIDSTRALVQVPEGQILEFTTEGSSGAATYDPLTGTLNIPEYGGGSDVTAEDVTCDLSGYSATLAENVDFTNVNEALLALLDFIYAPATITLTATPAQTVREKGVVVSSVVLSAVTGRRSNPITAVTFNRNGTLINTASSPNPDGGTSTFTDTSGRSDNTAYTATVNDGSTVTTSATVNYVFVYPYYSGVGAANLNAAAIAALTKSVIVSTPSRTVTFALSNQKAYFAYPSEYPALSSILVAGFESFDAFTARTVNITGLNGTTQSYRAYESNALLTGTTGTTAITFIQ